MTNEENGRIMTDTDALVDSLRFYQFDVTHKQMTAAADLIEQLVARDKQQAAEIERLSWDSVHTNNQWATERLNLIGELNEARAEIERLVANGSKWAKFSERHGWLDPEDFDHWIADLNVKLATEVKETVRLRYYNAELERQLEAARERKDRIMV